MNWPEANDLTKNSAFYHFGILPAVCIHSVIEDEYSKMYKPREKCDCGNSEWLTEGCTMLLGHYLCGTRVYKDVHRCSVCNAVRTANHIGYKN